MQYYDRTNRGLITFFDLRKVLQNLSLGIEEHLVEYLIYLMKEYNTDNILLDEMKYGNLIDLLSATTDLDDTANLSKMLGESQDSPKSQRHGNIETKEQKEDDDEVVITMDQFNEKVDKITSKIAEYLIKQRTTVKELFQDAITMHSINENETYEAVPLNSFLGILQKIQIVIDTLDIYCIFTKLKCSDDQELIDLAKLHEEMLNYGIFEEGFTKSVGTVHTTDIDLIEKLIEFMSNKNLSFDEIFRSSIIKKEDKEVIEQSKMIQTLKDYEVLNTTYEKLPQKFLDNFCLQDEEIDAAKLRQTIEPKLKENISKNKIIVLDQHMTDKKMEDSNSFNLDGIEDMDVEGLDDLA